MRWSELSDETKDGVLFGLSLAANPTLKARKVEYDKRIADGYAAVLSRTKAELIAELKAHNPAYVVDLLEADTEAGIRSRYVHTFFK